MSMLEGKVILVTGGGRGIGRAIVESLGAAGATVAFTYKSSAAAAEEIVATLQGAGRKVSAYQSDAASLADATVVVESVIREFGRLDVLVNNAGITRDGLLMRMS